LPTTSPLPTADLLKSLQNSALSAEEKKEFEGLLETMSEEAKLKLGKLIEDSNQAKNEFESKKARQLAELNEVTAENLKTLDREETKYVREECEKFDEQQTEKEWGDIEKNIEQERTTKIESTVQSPQKKRSETRNFILILLGLLLATVALIYGLLIS